MAGGEGDALASALPPHAETWLEEVMAAPDGLREVVNRLFALGSRVWLVGGCVRDVLANRGRAPHDVDLAVDVEPAVMLEGFGAMAIDTGSAFGTVTLKASGAVEPFQATTLRIDGTYVDGRHPEGVELVTDIALDLARRDLTINAMAIDLETRQLIDLHGGRSDLRGGRLRAVGMADERLEEDALRVLRVYRFAASPPPHHATWTVDGPLRSALRTRAPGLAAIPAERIWGELSRLLDAPLADQALAMMHEDRVLQDLLVDRHPAGAGLEALRGGHGLGDERLALLLSDHDGPGVDDVLRGLKAPKRVIARVRKLVAAMRTTPPTTPQAVRVLRHRLGEDTDVVLRLVNVLEGLGAVQGWFAAAPLIEATPPARVSGALLDGHAIMEATGLAHGQALGRLKDWLHYLQVERDLTTKESMLNLLCRLPWEQPDVTWPRL